MTKTTYIKHQLQIQQVKTTFSQQLCQHLQLVPVQAPILSETGTGIQDDLAGHEKAVSVSVKAIPDKRFEVVHSLAKWKRHTLARYGFEPGEGILTDMRALRPDEDSLSAKHSVYVDQWDWEKVIDESQRSVAFLKQTVRQIYAALLATEASLAEQGERTRLAEQVYFIDSEALAQQFPELSPKQREREITRQHGSVFIMGIGGLLKEGQPHDVRAPDYDDWSTLSEEGFTGLNGDLLVWHDGLQDALELSSMGIRVDSTALLQQLELSRQQHRAELPWHQALLTGQLPLTIGGGIGQSRVVMQLLQLDHIAQAQCGVWPEEVKHAL
jgi:aspartate--ammonia ligase